MLSAGFLFSVCTSVRLHQDVFEKVEECTDACKITGPDCGSTESCYCGICSETDLCTACGLGETCLGGICYSSLLDYSEDTLLSDSDCYCEDGEVCFWGICIDTSEGATENEDDPCYNCEHC